MTARDGGLRRLFRERLPQVHWQAVETGGTGLGVPDSNGCLRGREFWVEYKLTAARAVPLRPEQVAWHLRRARAGGASFVAVRRKCPAGARRLAADELHLFRGDRCALLRERGLYGCAPLGWWEGGPARWNWGEVLRLLTESPRTLS